MRGFVPALSLLLLAGPLVQSLEAQSSPNPWRDCGIGAMIFPDNQTAAAISNIIWDLGTTATSSAVTTPNACAGDAVQVAQFIDQTYPVLAMETAVGEGEHLVALVQLAGCEPSALGHVSRSLRQGFQGVLDREEYATAAHADRAYWYYVLLLEATASTPLCGSVS